MRIKNSNLLNFKCALNVDVLVITCYISQTQVAISQYQTCNKELLTRRGAWGGHPTCHPQTPLLFMMTFYE